MKGYTLKQIEEAASPLSFVVEGFNAALMLPDGRGLLYWHSHNPEAELFPEDVMSSVKLAKMAYKDVGGDVLFAAVESLNSSEPLPKSDRYELTDTGIKPLTSRGAGTDEYTNQDSLLLDRQRYWET